MITIAVEDWVATLPELKPLFPGHWMELALDKDDVHLDPQYDVYDLRNARGELLLVVMREVGAVIGYFIGFIAPGLHYRTCLTCTMDIFWTLPGKRFGHNGMKLFRFVEKEVERRGVQRWFVGTKLHKDAGALFRRLGFEPVEMYYSKFYKSRG